MKINSAGRAGAVRSTSKTRKSGASSGVGFSGMVNQTAETRETQAMTGLTGVGGVEALFALQEMGADQKSQAAMARGEELLDMLDQLRLHLLSGAIPENALADLATMAQTQRDSIADPRLAELLDDIDLRAQVELAKYERDRRRA